MYTKHQKANGETHENIAAFTWKDEDWYWKRPRTMLGSDVRDLRTTAVCSLLRVHLMELIR